MPDGELYNQIKYLVLLGTIHAALTVLVTEYLKSVWGLGSVGKRLFPLLWSVTVTILGMPHAVSAVGLEMPALGAIWTVAGLVLMGVVGAGGSYAIHNLWSLLSKDVLQAVKVKVSKWGER